MEDPLLDYHFDYRVFCLDLVALRVFSFKSISFSLKIEFCVFLSAAMLIEVILCRSFEYSQVFTLFV